MVNKDNKIFLLSFAVVLIVGVIATFFVKQNIWLLYIVFPFLILFVVCMLAFQMARKKNRVQQVMETKREEFEAYRTHYANVCDELPEKRMYDSSLKGFTIFWVVLTFVFAFLAEFSTKDLLPFGMMFSTVIIIMVFVYLFLKVSRHPVFQNKDNENRRRFMECLLQKINPEYRYDSNRDEARQAFQSAFPELAYYRTIKVLDSIQASHFQLCNLEMHGRKGSLWYYLFLMIQPSNDVQKEDTWQMKVKEYINKMGKEYELALKTNIVSDKVYVCIEPRNRFFVSKSVDKDNIDDWSLYYLYCATKLANDISEMRF